MKKKTKIFACAMAVLVLLAAALGVLYWTRSSAFYSEEQHLSRIRERAEERFLSEGSEYTGLEVYPIYNEEDKLEYALIELEPQGFMYVKIRHDVFLELFDGLSMYIISVDAPTPWSPYRIVEGEREFLTDENGEPIQYFHSHFKVAGIEDERRYLLDAPYDSLIPAVKRGEQYLDLMDGEPIDYDPDALETYASEMISFIPKPGFDL